MQRAARNYCSGWLMTAKHMLIDNINVIPQLNAWNKYLNTDKIEHIRACRIKYRAKVAKYLICLRPYAIRDDSVGTGHYRQLSSNKYKPVGDYRLRIMTSRYRRQGCFNKFHQLAPDIPMHCPKNAGSTLPPLTITPTRLPE